MSGLICVEQVYPCKFRTVEYVPVLKPRQNQQLIIFEGIITISDAEDSLAIFYGLAFSEAKGRSKFQLLTSLVFQSSNIWQ